MFEDMVIRFDMIQWLFPAIVISDQFAFKVLNPLAALPVL